MGRALRLSHTRVPCHTHVLAHALSCALTLTCTLRRACAHKCSRALAHACCHHAPAHTRNRYWVRKQVSGQGHTRHRESLPLGPWTGAAGSWPGEGAGPCLPSPLLDWGSRLGNLGSHSRGLGMRGRPWPGACPCPAGHVPSSGQEEQAVPMCRPSSASQCPHHQAALPPSARGAGQGYLLEHHSLEKAHDMGGLSKRGGRAPHAMARPGSLPACSGVPARRA